MPSTDSKEAPVGYKINDGKGGTITKTDKGWFRSADNYLIPTNSPAHQDYEKLWATTSGGSNNGNTGASNTTTPGTEDPAATEKKPAAPTMTKDQISQWITRNSEDNAALSALWAAINSAGKA